MNTGSDSDIILSGPGMDGQPFALRRGQVAVLHVMHDRGCPALDGHPERCNCRPDVALGPMDPATAAAMGRHGKQILTRHGGGARAQKPAEERQG